MSIVGAVIRVQESPQETSRDIAARLAAEPSVTCGPVEADRLAFVAEARTTHELTELLDAIGRWPGVITVSPVFHEFEDELSDGALER